MLIMNVIASPSSSLSSLNPSTSSLPMPSSLNIYSPSSSSMSCVDVLTPSTLLEDDPTLYDVERGTSLTLFELDVFPSRDLVHKFKLQWTLAKYGNLLANNLFIFLLWKNSCVMQLLSHVDALVNWFFP